MQSNARAKAGCLQRAAAAHLYIILKDKVRVEAFEQGKRDGRQCCCVDGACSAWREGVVAAG